MNGTQRKTMPSADNIELAQFLAGALGFDPKVCAYYDHDNKNSLDILSLTDPLDSNVAFYCTIGLSDSPNLVNETNIPIELLITGYKEFKQTPNILSTCGFYIAKDGYECRPGAVFMRMVEFYYTDLAMKHIYFTTPFLWPDKLAQLNLATKSVNFLLCIPISDEELRFKLEHGDDALESLFEENDINIFDLNRESVV